MKFFIYKGSGGLFHNLGGLCRAIEYCTTYKYILIIDMKKHRAFQEDFSSFFTIQYPKLLYYDNYDIISSTKKWKDISIEKIKNLGTSLEKGSYMIQGKNISKIQDDNNIIVYAKYDIYIPKYNIQTNKTITDLLKKETSIEKPYIAIHYRNTDIKNQIQLFITKIRNIVSRKKIDTLYIASDYDKTYEIIKKHFPKIDIIQYTKPPTNIKNLHYTSQNKYKQLYDSIRDIYFILKSTYFIPSRNSGFSKSIIKMIQNRKTIIPNIISKTILL